MKKVGILVLALMASFGASAKPLTEAGLKKHAENVCGMRDTLDLKVPFDNKAPTEPLNTVNRGVVHAARDAAQVNKRSLTGVFLTAGTSLQSNTVLTRKIRR